MPLAKEDDSPGPIFRAAELCRASLRTCLEYDVLMRNQWAETRLADFNLWASGIGALARPRASLDRRLDFRPDARDVVLSALRRLQREADRCAKLASPYDLDYSASHASTAHTTACETDSLLALGMSEVEASLEQLLRLSVAIRRSGTQARLVRADQSLVFQSHAELYMLLLSKIVATRHSATRHTPTVSASVEMPQLSEVQRRLIHANLKRRNRFIYAQKHSHSLAPYEKAGYDHLRAICNDIKSAIFWILIKTFVVLLLCIHFASNARRLMPGQERMVRINASTRTRSRTRDHSGQVLDSTSEFSRLPVAAPLKEISSDAMTQLSTTTKLLEYPQPPAIDQNSKGFKCPCCCETLPVMFARDTFWKKHIREDLAPYTCVMPNCPSPMTLYTRKEDWKDHLQHGHTQTTYWLCPLCPKSVQREPDSDVQAVRITQFDDEAIFEAHLVSKHPRAEKHVASIKDQSRRVAPAEIDRCPLCPFPGHAEAKLDRLALLNHIANDVHAFSLYSLPWPADGPEGEAVARASTNDEINQWLHDCASSVQDGHNDLRDRDNDRLLSAGEGYDAMEPSTATYLRCITGEISHAIESGVLRVDPTQTSGRYNSTFFEGNAYFSEMDRDSDDATVPGSQTQAEYRAFLDDDSLSHDMELPFCNIPLSRSPDFVERTTLAEQIRARLAVPAGRVALVGMGGLGKTQLAIDSVLKLREQSPQTRVIWIDAYSIAVFEQSLGSIADFLKLPEPQSSAADTLQLLQNWLRDESKGSWVVVFDSADDADFLVERPAMSRKAGAALSRMDYIPRCEHVSVLITTRHKSEAQKLVDDNDIIEVPRMSEQEAEALLNKLGHADPDLQHLIPALEHLFEEQESAAELLWLMSFCDPTAIPKGLLQPDAGDADDPVGSLTFGKDIDVLTTRSLVLKTADPKVFEISRLVQSATHVWLKERGRLESVLDSFVHRMYTLFPDAEFTDWTRCRVLFPHAMSLIEHRPVRRDSLLEWASIMHKAAWFARKQRDYNNALTLAKSSLDVRSGYLGGEDELTLCSKANVAKIYSEQGELDEAQRLQAEVVATRNRVLGEEHPDTLRIVEELAATYFSQGRWRKAEGLQEAVLMMRKKVLADDHPDTLICMNDLAWTYSRRGRREEAEKLQLEVLQTSRKVLGDAHSDTLTRMAELAQTYSYQERWKEAEKLQVEVLQASRKVLGDAHPDTLTRMADLAWMYYSQSRWEEAAKLQVEVLQASRKVLGDAHPDTLTRMVDLASTYLSQGQYGEAEELQMEILEGRGKILGPNHPSTVESMSRLAATYWLQGRLSESEALLKDVVAKRQEILGEDHLDTWTSTVNLAITYFRRDRIPEALEMLERVDEAKQKLAETDPRRLALWRAGEAHYWTGWKCPEAVETLLREICGPQDLFENPTTDRTTDGQRQEDQLFLVRSRKIS